MHACGNPADRISEVAHVIHQLDLVMTVYKKLSLTV